MPWHGLSKKLSDEKVVAQKKDGSLEKTGLSSIREGCKEKG
jgi:hypothetical protein